MLKQGDKRLFFEVMAPEQIPIEEFSTGPPNEWDDPNPDTRQVGFHMDLEPGTATTVAVLLAPGSIHESISALPPLRPLAQWAE